MKIAVIGGGAAGYFAACTAAASDIRPEVVIVEASSKTLAKVRISGGGRCNVTHACFDPMELVEYYPRGKKELRQAFSQFMTGDTVEWFEKRGVQLKIESDGRMFPVTDDSETIIRCLTAEAEKYGVKVWLRSVVQRLAPVDGGIELDLGEGNKPVFDRVIVAIGGQSKASGFDLLANVGHTIVTPVPSLFTFTVHDPSLRALMGISVEQATVSLPAFDVQAEGPLLITHWGFSGPAVLRLSSWAARELAQVNYRFIMQVNWCGDQTSAHLEEQLRTYRKQHTSSPLTASPFAFLSKRLWSYLLERSGIRRDIQWADMRNQELTELCRVLSIDEYEADGKTTFKEEFVTCGGISLKEVDFRTMQSKRMPGLFFAGEVLDIDAVTGGFNFQAAWTTGFIAGRSAVVEN